MPRLTIRQMLAVCDDQVGQLDDRAARAALLVAAAHTTRDRDVWGGDRALSYWDRLPDRVRTATYAGPTLGHWWERMCSQLGCGQPTVADDREALAEALAGGDDRAVLATLRDRTQELCLRVRLALQLARQPPPSQPEPEVDQPTMEIPT